MNEIVQFFQNQDYAGLPISGWFWQDDYCSEPMGPFKTLEEARADHRTLRAAEQARRLMIAKLDNDELLELVEEIDPDWRDHYFTLDLAAAGYMVELAKLIEEERIRCAEDSEVPADWFAGGFCDNH